MSHATPFEELIGRIEGAAQIDDVADAALDRARQTVGSGPLGSVLRGEPFGHRVHPFLTDLPIGFWTSAVTLDLLMPRSSHIVARRLVGLGVLCAVPTALAGWADGADLRGPEERRVAMVHAVGNWLATAMFTASWWSRRKERHLIGKIWALLATVVATGAGLLGGHLAFGADRAAGARSATTTDDPRIAPPDRDGRADLVDAAASTHLPQVGGS